MKAIYDWMAENEVHGSVKVNELFIFLNSLKDEKKSTDLIKSNLIATAIRIDTEKGRVWYVPYDDVVEILNSLAVKTDYEVIQCDRKVINKAYKEITKQMLLECANDLNNHIRNMSTGEVIDWLEKES